MSDLTEGDTIFSPRVLSGVQPSGSLHLGNYFGAIKQHIELQHEYPGEAFYFIANLHALTTIQDREIVERETWNVALSYLALGLDPNKATFYRQSDVPQVCELMWILSCVTGKGLLDRAHSYKDKLSKGIRPTMGLFSYPILMAADILAVRATMVPVGQDQTQHMEITRDIANSFNSAYKGVILPLPETKLNDAAVVPGVDGLKMSKSYNNTIPFFADDDVIEARILSIKTSSVAMGQPLDAENDTVFALYKLIASPEQQKEMYEMYRSGSIGYGKAKNLLFESARDYFKEYKARFYEFQKDPDTVEDILREGAKRAREEINNTVEMLREIVGLGRYQRRNH